jgi:fibronectin type 3 domain-containing protein
VKRRAGVLLLAVAAAGCGKKGDPLPPLPTRPARTRDLAIEQQGESAELSFTFPSTRVDGAPLRDLVEIDVYRMESPSPALTSETLATGGPSDHAPISGERRRAEAERRREEQIVAASRRVATIPADLFPAATRGSRLVWRDDLRPFLTLPHPPPLAWAVVTVRRNGERSEVSNIAALTPAVPPEAPADLTADAEPARICVEWRPPEKDLSGAAVEIAGYRVYRRLLSEPDYGPPLNAEPVAVAELADTSAAYGSTYVYTVTAIAKDRPKAEGPPAIQFGIEYRDVFPPAAVERVDALPEEHRVRLSWTAVDAPDVAEYRIFRSEGNGAPVLLGKTPADRTEFDDETVSPGGTYRYTVRAVDKSGNESASSPEVTAKPFQ